MSTRKSTGKRLRFSVFERDHFTCQYCGAQPPEVVLVIDHITTVAAGGPSDADNLITSCEECNQGKAARILGQGQPRPDADLMYLATQQEIAEISRYRQALEFREAAIQSLVSRLQERWMSSTGLDWCPSERIIRQLITRYGHEVAGAALEDVSYKVASNYLRGDSWVPYVFTVARNMSEEDGASAEDVASS